MSTILEDRTLVTKRADPRDTSEVGGSMARTSGKVPMVFSKHLKQARFSSSVPGDSSS